MPAVAVGASAIDLITSGCRPVSRDRRIGHSILVVRSTGPYRTVPVYNNSNDLAGHVASPWYRSASQGERWEQSQLTNKPHKLVIPAGHANKKTHLSDNVGMPILAYLLWQAADRQLAEPEPVPEPPVSGRARLPVPSPVCHPGGRERSRATATAGSQPRRKRKVAAKRRTVVARRRLPREQVDTAVSEVAVAKPVNAVPVAEKMDTDVEVVSVVTPTSAVSTPVMDENEATHHAVDLTSEPGLSVPLPVRGGDESQVVFGKGGGERFYFTMDSLSLLSQIWTLNYANLHGKMELYIIG
ncbi:hypothetical protein GBF38_000059 [Nibea albiflora]|nr:hypothetical protein GBF38_000059 [Nibea albiflora]